MEQTTLSIRGLYTNPNLVSKAPKGALITCENIVLQREGLAEPVRGMDRLYCDMPDNPDPSARVEYIFWHKKILHYVAGAHLVRVDSQSVSVVITDSCPTVKRIVCSDNAYLATSEGLRALGSESGLRKAGISTPFIAFSSEETESESPGILKPKYVRSYRAAIKLSMDDRELIGPPSNQLTVYNSGESNLNIQLEVIIPAQNNDVSIELYRTADTLLESENVSNPEQFIPTDEHFFIQSVKSSEETNKTTVTFSDTVDQNHTGHTLYTSESQEGILNANQSPPVSEDICEHKGRLFYASPLAHPYILDKLKTIELYDYFQIDSFRFRFTDENLEDNEQEFFLTFQDDDYGNVSNLCKYISGKTDKYTANILSGRGEISEISVESSGFDSFRLRRGHDQGVPHTDFRSKSGLVKNGLAFSKFQEYEAVPRKNLILIGHSDPILRILSLKDSLIIFKQRGIYRLFGTDELDFSVDCLDADISLIANESPAILNNTIFCLTSQGVYAITETSAQKISANIDNLIDKIRYNTKALEETHALAYIEENRYYLLTQTYGKFIFNLETGQWSSWKKAVNCAAISPVDGKLYIGSPRSYRIELERKSFTNQDHIDYDGPLSLVNIGHRDSPTEILDPDKKARINDRVYFEDHKQFRTVIDIKSGHIDYNQIWLDGDSFDGPTHLYKPVATTIEWDAFNAGFPTFLKQFTEARLVFNEHKASDMVGSLAFYTDLDSQEIPVDFRIHRDSPFWGSFPFGSIPLAQNRKTDINMTAMLVPRNMQKSHRLSVVFRAKNYESKFELSGVTLNYRTISRKGARFGSGI